MIIIIIFFNVNVNVNLNVNIKLLVAYGLRIGIAKKSVFVNKKGVMNAGTALFA